jgi:hypothetical protein
MADGGISEARLSRRSGPQEDDNNGPENCPNPVCVERQQGPKTTIRIAQSA